MKMVKSLLLGSAAGVVAAAGAQAADLPVKAKPVEYVKVCSLYGAGYYYIPGTDICSKIGGYVRYEANYGSGNAATVGPWASSNSNTSYANSRAEGSADYINRVRAYITAETRQQTAYGTLRTYVNVGVNVDVPGAGALGATAGGFNANRAFIQIAGFTIGRAVSYYDFYCAPCVAYITTPSSDIGDPGTGVMAYTAQFGNGVSGTIALEENRNTSPINSYSASISTLASFPAGGGGAKKREYPDVVAALRVDQAWGSAQVAGAIHDASPGYWNNATTAIGVSHPGDRMGWAVMGGLRVNTPFISPGDYGIVQFNYTQGAVKYVAVSQPASSVFGRNGSSFGYGVFTDSVYWSTGSTSGTEAELTTAWGVNAAYEHFWTPAVRSSLYVSYVKFQYNANANSYLCSAWSTTQIASSTCNNDWSMLSVGSRSQWNVTKDFYLGFDVLYQKLKTASGGTAAASWTGTGTMPTGVYSIADQSQWVFRLRAHRDIVP